MNEHIAIALSVKTNEELFAYIDNREKFHPETVEAAVAELQSRNVEFTSEELDVIREDMKARRELAMDEPGQNLFITSGWKYKTVDDDYAPAYFSQQVILLFSIFFGVLFGSILLAINISKTENRDKAYMVVLYGLLFEIAPVLLFQGSIVGPILMIMAKVLGGFMLASYFWNIYIGNGRLYKARPYWVPLTIGLALLAINVVLIILVQNKGISLGLK